MTTSIRVPKRISVEDLIQGIGQARTEELLTAIYGAKLAPPPTIKVTEAQLQAAITCGTRGWARGNKSNRWEFMKSLPVFRKWLAENPRHSNAFIKWCQIELTDVNGGEQAPEGQAVITTTATKGRRRQLHEREAS